MKTKTKIMVSILVMAFAIIAVVSTIIAVLALTQQSITTSLSVNYAATRDVYASITGGVYSNSTEQQDIALEINGASTSGNLDLSYITIDPNDPEKSVYIEFVITNNQPNDEEAELYVNPSVTATTAENIAQSKLVSFDNTTNFETFTESNVCIQKGQTAYIRLKFKVEDITKDASLQGEISLNLHSIESNQLPMDAFTSTIAGIGAYPQKYVGNTLNNTLKTATLTATGKTYTTDIWDTPATLTEYTYNNQKVAKLEGSKDGSYGNAKFSTGESVSDNSTYFFYVQPIKVSAMERRGDKTIYLTKSALFSRNFHPYDEENFPDTYGSNPVWETSALRTFLNDTFLEESGITAKQISIENGTASGSYQAQDNTTDTIWLPSKTEVETWYTTNNARKKDCTDMALATGTYKYSGATYYWTRSASSSDGVYLVDDFGALNILIPLSDRYGVCFAFAL